MKITTWNIKGLGSRRKHRNLSNKIKEEKPDIVFIQEIKCSVENVREKHRKWIKRYEYLEVKANKFFGGILTLWDPQKFGMLDTEASRHHLSLISQLVGDRQCYMITNVYHPQPVEEKLRLITTLEDMKKRYQALPWILRGDFNMIKSLTRRKGELEHLVGIQLPSRTFSPI